MECGYYQVYCDGGLNSYLGCLAVSNLSDHDNVRILTKDGTQAGGEGQTNLIGFHAEGNYTTAVGESFALMGMTLWAEYADAIAVVTVDPTYTPEGGEG